MMQDLSDLVVRWLPWIAVAIFAIIVVIIIALSDGEQASKIDEWQEVTVRLPNSATLLDCVAKVDEGQVVDMVCELR